MGKPRMNNKTTQWEQSVGFACGYVGARLEPKGLLSPDDAAYYCVASSGEEGILYGNELRDRILKGSNNLQERGKYSCDFLNATVMQNGSIRLSTGIPTIKLDFKNSKESVQNYVAKVQYTKAWEKMLIQAVKKAEKSWYATHDKVEEKAPAKKSGTTLMDGYGSGEFKMPADVKKALEEFKKVHPELLTKKAVADARYALAGEGAGDEDMWQEDFEFMLQNNRSFEGALRRCYGTTNMKAYPNDLLCLIRWRQRSTFVADKHKWLQEGVEPTSPLVFADLIASMKIWQYCGDWRDPEYVCDTHLKKFIADQSEEPMKKIEAFEKLPVWKRVALETQILYSLYDANVTKIKKDGKAGFAVLGKKCYAWEFLEEDFFVRHKEYMSRCPMGNLQRKAYYPERYKENHPDLPASVPMKNAFISAEPPCTGKLITNYITRDDIDLTDKLDNLVGGGEISERVCKLCKQPRTFMKIEEKIWNLMKNSAEPFHDVSYYDGLAKEYDAKDDHDLKSAEVYNCDLLYMVAIASVLKLPRPKHSGDFEMFWNEDDE